MPTYDLLSGVIAALGDNNQETTQQAVLAAVGLLGTEATALDILAAVNAATAAAGGALTNAQLRAAPVDAEDDYDGNILTNDQSGAGGILTFTLGAPAALVAVDVDNSSPSDTTIYIARATVDGTNPTSSRGWRCRSGQTTLLPVPSPGGEVRVFAPSGVTVSVQAATRA